MIYFVEAVGLKCFKVGFTEESRIYQRLMQLQSGCPVPLRLVAVLEGGKDIESRLHRRFRSSQRFLEWFDWSKDLDYVIRYAQRGGRRLEYIYAEGKGWAWKWIDDPSVPEHSSRGLKQYCPGVEAFVKRTVSVNFPMKKRRRRRRQRKWLKGLMKW